MKWLKVRSFGWDGTSETRKPIHLIIDNAGYHTSKKVQAFLDKNKKGDYP